MAARRVGVRGASPPFASRLLVLHATVLSTVLAEGSEPMSCSSTMRSWASICAFLACSSCTPCVRSVRCVSDMLRGGAGRAGGRGREGGEVVRARGLEAPFDSSAKPDGGDRSGADGKKKERKRRKVR